MFGALVLMTLLLYNDLCLFAIDFVLKSILSDMSIATPVFPVVSICMKYLFLPSHFHNVCIFSFESELLVSSFQMALDFYPVSCPMSFDWCL